MSNHNDNYCGGDPTKIKIISPISCTTSNSNPFSSGDYVFWKSDKQLGSCDDEKIDTTNDKEIKFKIIASSGDDFCPKYVTVMIG